MTAYRAPIRDMIFAMKEIGGLDRIAALPGNEDASDDLVEAIFEEAGKFAGDVLAPLNRSRRQAGLRLQGRRGDHARRRQGGLRGFCENGWHAMPAPLGLWRPGPAQPGLDAGAGNVDGGRTGLLAVPDADARRHRGHRPSRSEAQKQLYLPKMVAGTWTGTMNLTEPQAGSDLAAVRTTRRARGRRLPDQRHEDLHHLGRARRRRKHRSSGAGASARRPCRREGHFAVHRPEIPGERRRLARRAQRSSSASSIEHKLGIHGSPTA